MPLASTWLGTDDLPSKPGLTLDAKTGEVSAVLGYSYPKKATLRAAERE
jgi:hypothetical protein